MLDDVYENPTLEIDKYKKAVEKTLEELPVENGVIGIEALWLELTLPEDLLIEILAMEDIVLPLNVEKVLAQKKEPEGNGAGDASSLNT